MNRRANTARGRASAAATSLAADVLVPRPVPTAAVPATAAVRTALWLEMLIT
jgi:hypothetical protein